MKKRNYPAFFVSSCCCACVGRALRSLDFGPSLPNSPLACFISARVYLADHDLEIANLPLMEVIQGVNYIRHFGRVVFTFGPFHTKERFFFIVSTL